MIQHVNAGGLLLSFALLGASVAAVPPLVLAPAETGGRRVPKLVGALDDVLLVLLLGTLFPFAILAVGMPVVLVLRLLIEIAARL